MRKLLIIFAMLMLMMLSVSAVNISSADDMLALMKGTLSWDGDYTLTSDIDLNSCSGQSAIGTAENPFTGTFDGDGHAVKGLNITAADSTGTVAGLFGKIDGATVKNLTVEGSVNTTATYVGGIVAYSVNSSSILNCTNRAAVANGAAKDSAYENNGTGGVVGRVLAEGASSTVYNTVLIENCRNEGTVNGNFEVGGVIGLIGATSAKPYGHITVSGCMNSGNISASSGRVGGVIGYFVACGTDICAVQDCVNTGDIYTGSTVAAGIIGAGNLGGRRYTLTRCFNSGSITSGSASPDYIHPIIGAATTPTITYETITDCYYSSTDTYTDNKVAVFEVYASLDNAESLSTSLGDKWILANGYIPELALFHTHTLGGYVATNTEGHYKTCYCGYETEKEVHSFVDKICTVCGASACAHDGGKTYKGAKTKATCVSGGIDIYTCDLCGSEIEVASEKDSENHSPSIEIKVGSGKVNFVCADCEAVCLSRTETDIYVSENGASVFTKDNIETVGSESTPYASFEDAMVHAAAVASEGASVNVHIVDSASVPTDYVSPEYDGEITVSGGNLSTANVFSLGGALTVENITLTPSKATVFEAKENKLVMGEGIKMGNSAAMYVVGGYDSHFSSSADVPTHGFSTDVTIRSGKYSYVSGGNRDMKAEYRGEIKLTAGKTNPSDTLTVTKILCTASLGDDYATEAKLTLTIDGGINFAGTGILYVLSGSQRGERCNFDADIFLKSKISNYIGVRYHGNYTANLYVDTTVEGIDKTVADIMQGEAKLHPLGDCKTASAKDTDAPFGEKAIHSFTFGKVRITVLSDTVVRVEENLGGGFVDAATLVVPEREKFGGACVATDFDGDTAIIKTAELIINLPKENASADAVKIFGKDGNILFDFYNSHMHGFYSSLPAPSETPDAYVLVDNGIIPAGDMVYSGSEEANSGWVVSENIDYYVIAINGDSAKLRQDFVTLTGSTAMSDIKFYGSWYSRWSKFTAEEKLAMIANYRAHNIPLDVIVIDTEWRANTDGTGYETNTELYPDMEKFLSDAENAGVLVLFNDHTHSTSLTILTPSEFKWQCANISKLMDMGLDGWWYDRNWSYTIKSPYTNVLYSTLGQVLYNDTMAKFHADNAADGESGKRVLMLTNADWLRHGFAEGNPSVIGHRYGMQWSGDIYGDSLQLGREIENTVISGVVGGSPYISADLGGFRNNDTVSEYAFIRWMQFGAFSSALRVHSDINPKNPHYPWSYTEVAKTAVRNYFNMRYHLMPYFYTLAYENHESGMPLIRRLDFHYPEYEESKDNTQYLLGKDILVAPYNGNAGDGTKTVPAEWLKTSSGESGLDAAYYDIEGKAKDKYFDGTPAYTETVSEINNFWDQWGPNGVGTDYFAARYTGTVTPDIDCYIGLVVDDGGRIYIDGELWSGTWSNKFADAEVNTEKALKAGQTYDVVVEYYEASSKAQLYFVYDEVTEADESTRSVFIPDGEWIDVFTGEIITGPKTISVTKDVYSSPIYVKKGAVIPTTEVESPLSGGDFENISLNVYGIGEGSASLYEDDGATEAYLDGDYRTTGFTLSTSDEISTLEISAANGEYTSGYTLRNFTVRIHSDKEITSALVNGKAASITKIAKDADALPFANKGASAISDVYEISFTASVNDAHTVTLTTSDTPLEGKVVGDVNGNGVLEMFDVLTVLKSVLNGENVDADTDLDGEATLLDVIKLLKQIA